RSLGVVPQKRSPDITMVVHLFSPDGRYDPVYLRNYALLNVRNELSRIPGAGQVIVFGAGDYAMRVWLDPNRVASHGLSAGDVVQAIREQNLQVAAGTVGAPPVNDPVAYQLTVVARGRLTDEKEFGNIIVKTGADGQTTRLRDVARIELGPGTFGLRALLDNKPAVAVVVFQSPGSNALALSSAIRARMADLKTRFPQGVEWSSVYDPVAFISGLDGQFYRQFALTIAFSTLISAFNSLTLSPALAAVLLKPRGATEDAPTRIMHRLLGWLFDPFNRLFGRASNRYG